MESDSTIEWLLFLSQQHRQVLGRSPKLILVIKKKIKKEKKLDKIIG